jgi:WXG100 family type VII secretion target
VWPKHQPPGQELYREGACSMAIERPLIQQNYQKLMSMSLALSKKVQYLEQIDALLQGKVKTLEGSWSGNAQVAFAEEWLRARKSLKEAQDQIKSLGGTIDSLAHQEMQKLRSA